MISVSVEVCSRGARFRATVSAESIEEAVCLAKARYPRGEARVLFPIDPELFFTVTTATVPGTRRPDIPEEARRAGEKRPEAQQLSGRVKFV